MARLLLVRHAPTPETGVRLTGRLPGVHLDDAGRRAATEIGRFVAGARPVALYSSPVERTWETALEIGAVTGLEPIAHPGLTEVDFGRWSGRTLRDLSRLKAWSAVQSVPSRVRFPDGESLVEARDRAVAACEDIARSHRRQTVVLVSHADVIKAVLSHYLGQALDQFQRLVVMPASVSVVDLPSQGAPRVLGVNLGVEWR